VLAPGGRGLITVWVPAGPIDAMVGVFIRAVSRRAGRPPARFPWHQPDEVHQLLEPYDVTVYWHEGALQIKAASPQDYLDAHVRSHPMSVASRPLLETTGDYATTRQEALDILCKANESDHSFQVTSPYRVIEIERAA
jgi:hypothetical protein